MKTTTYDRAEQSLRQCSSQLFRLKQQLAEIQEVCNRAQMNPTDDTAQDLAAHINEIIRSK